METEQQPRGVPARDAAETEALITMLVTRWSASLLRTARRHSLCDDDAQDAYAQAMEQLVRHADRLRREDAHGWLHTVVKHAALALRERRVTHEAGIDPAGMGESLAAGSPEERLVDLDDLERAAEALTVLRPQELRALWLQAHGLSYREIGEATSWTYTKVNRCLTEGRRSFLAHYRSLEEGTACGGFAEALVAVAGGEQRVGQVHGLRSHLRHCGWCRATLRERHVTDAPLSVLLPASGVPVLGGGAADPVRETFAHAFVRCFETIAAGTHDRAGHAAVRLQAATDAVLTGKAAAVAASAVAIAGGGVAVERSATAGGGGSSRAVAAETRPVSDPTDPGAPGLRSIPRDEIRPLPVVAEQRLRRVARARARRAAADREFAAERRRRELAAGEFGDTRAPAPTSTATSREFAGATGTTSGSTAPAASGPAVSEFSGGGGAAAAGDEFGG